MENGAKYREMENEIKYREEWWRMGGNIERIREGGQYIERNREGDKIQGRIKNGKI